MKTAANLTNALLSELKLHGHSDKLTAIIVAAKREAAEKMREAILELWMKHPRRDLRAAIRALPLPSEPQANESEYPKVRYGEIDGRKCAWLDEDEKQLPGDEK